MGKKSIKTRKKMTTINEIDSTKIFTDFEAFLSESPGKFGVDFWIVKEFLTCCVSKMFHLAIDEFWYILEKI